MRRVIVTIGALSLFGGLAGCVVHERAPRTYGYAAPVGPRHEWREERREERRERHEAREHEWRVPEDHD